jgi:hypothetical protein
MTPFERFQLETYGDILKPTTTFIQAITPKELEDGEHDDYSIFDTDFIEDPF